MQNLDTIYNKFLMNRNAIKQSKELVSKSEDLRSALGKFLNNGHNNSIISDSDPGTGSKYTLKELIRDSASFTDRVSASRPLNKWEEELVDPLLSYVNKQMLFTLPDLKKIREGLRLSFADAYAATYTSLSDSDKEKANDMFREVLQQWY
ncbi:hypothetical protein PR1_115 [Providencia phage vB_PreS_PR1]|uniref:Uncharacterized protein n=1 Tax=Providencia phage vB_PreS_PR1 TaxID=1931407 RepID=A0A1S6KV36_9CAUD|nr:hypothetical protein FDH30_gp099 [Providencia phage vB_PreS_PR1]AQT25274.1 hypothetical protein PR1_115 [Providencia phage vB_PreS_PR1]